MIHLRDIGVFISRMFPKLTPFLRTVYMNLPSFLHDTPSSRARKYFQKYENVNFMVIGAHDGISGDPVHPIIRENWHGVLIEPQPDIFNILQKNYKKYKNIITLNVAISNSKGEKKIFFINKDYATREKLPSWCTEIASFEKGHIQKHFPGAPIDEINVKCITFDEAAKFLPDSRIDLLCVDVEGHEKHILESIDYEKHKIKFVIFEHKHLPRTDYNILENLLTRKGYKMKKFGRDTIAFK